MYTYCGSMYISVNSAGGVAGQFYDSKKVHSYKCTYDSMTCKYMFMTTTAILRPT